MALISCQDTSFSYDGNPVIKGLNFEINDGDYLCIVGENGSGKSTLIKGLLQMKQPAGGQLLFDSGLKADEIGYLPQQTVVQRDFPASVYEIVLSGRLGRCGIYPFYSKADKAAAEANIKRLDIGHLRNRCYRELSGGQQQRVLLARALSAVQRVLILDEPAAGLDPLVTWDLYQQIYKVNHEMGITIIMVSHDIANAVRHASHILHLRNEQLFFGTAADYIKSSISAEFLGIKSSEFESSKFDVSGSELTKDGVSGGNQHD